jgi:hypothetical protein
MKNFDELKSAWKKETPPAALQYEEAKKRADHYRSSHVRKRLLSIGMLSAVIVVFVLILLNYEAKYITTPLGLLLAGMAIVCAIGWETVLIQFLMKPIDMQADSKTFLTYWQTYQKRVEWAQKTGISLYFILLSLGLALYLFEFANRDWRYGVFFYLVTGAWILFNWFYFRPRVIKKQNQKTRALMEDAERLASQLEE